MTTTATPDTVTALREKVESLHLQDEADYLESVIRNRQEAESLIEDWGDFVDPLDAMRSEQEYFGGGVGAARADRPDDRRNGDFAPHFRNETELARIRGMCTWLADTDVTVIGAFETLTAFVLKQGSTYEVTVNEQTAALGQQFQPAVQEVLDEFTGRVNWYGSVDKESFNRCHKAGTRFLRITDVGDGYSGVEFYEPSWITEPLNKEQIAEHYGLAPGLDWKYGVITDPDNVSLVWGYYAAKHGDAKCGEFISVDEMDRLKVNTDSNVKLGLPDLYAGRKWATKCEKLLERMLDGAAIQASIALRRTYPAGTRNTQIGNAADASVEFRGPAPAVGGGTATVKYQQFRSGEIVDQKGVNLEAGPMGQGQGEIYASVLQTGLRVFSRRWGITEDAISGDASNNTLASLAEAGSTCLMRMQASQAQIATNDVNVFWRVVKRAVDAGRIVGIAFERLKQLITIKVTPADIEHRERKEECDIRVAEHQAGILSRATWATETGRDWEEEQKKIAEEEPVVQPSLGVRIDGMPGSLPQQLNGRPGVPFAPPQQQPDNLHQATESRTATLAVRAMDILLEMTRK